MHQSLIVCRPPRAFAALLATLFAVSATLVHAEPNVTAFYDPADGTISLSVLDQGNPATLNVSAFQFLSPSQYLSGSAAAIPPAAVSFFTVLNTDASAIYEPPRQYAEIYANGLGGTLLTSSWDLGTVAQPGLTQADLNAGFISNGDVLAPAQPGKFLYESNATWFAGDMVAVPEPNFMVGATVAGAVFLITRIKRQICRRSDRTRRSPTG